MNKVIQEGNTLKLRGQGFGTMTEAGSGEKQLMSLISAIGVTSPEEKQEWMNGFIPPTRED
jgi:hypothetical protein